MKDYIDRDGSIEAALKSYVGAAFMSSDSGYGEKVLIERERLAAVVKAGAMNAVDVQSRRESLAAVKTAGFAEHHRTQRSCAGSARQQRAYAAIVVRQMSADQAPACRQVLRRP